VMIVPLKEPRAIESIAPTTAEVITPAKITEACLRDASFCRERGTGSELLYTVADRIPEIPAPREREYGNPTAPARV